MVVNHTGLLGLCGCQLALELIADYNTLTNVVKNIIFALLFVSLVYDGFLVGSRDPGTEEIYGQY